MEPFTLGEDIYLEFKVKVGHQLAQISSAQVELYKKDKLLGFFTAQYKAGRVFGTIPGAAIKSIGNYDAKFKYFLTDMGKRELAIPFKITKSVLGKKRVVV